MSEIDEIEMQAVTALRNLYANKDGIKGLIEQDPETFLELYQFVNSLYMGAN